MSQFTVTSQLTLYICCLGLGIILSMNPKTVTGKAEREVFLPLVLIQTVKKNYFFKMKLLGHMIIILELGSWRQEDPSELAGLPV